MEHAKIVTLDSIANLPIIFLLHAVFVKLENMSMSSAAPCAIHVHPAITKTKKEQQTAKNVRSTPLPISVNGHRVKNVLMANKPTLAAVSARVVRRGNQALV